MADVIDFTPDPPVQAAPDAGGTQMETTTVAPVSFTPDSAKIDFTPAPNYLPSASMPAPEHFPEDYALDALDTGARAVGGYLGETGRNLLDVASEQAGEVAGAVRGAPPSYEESQRELETTPEQIAANARGEHIPTPTEETISQEPGLEQVFTRGARSLLQMSPQLAAVAALEAVGVPAPVGAAAVFGSTENGFDAKQAALAAAIPYVGKQTGAIVERLAGKLGISSEAALGLFNKAGGAAGATAFLGTFQAAEIADLPPEKRKAAVIDAVANDVAMLPLSAMGGGEAEGDRLKAEVEGDEKGSSPDTTSPGNAPPGANAGPGGGLETATPGKTRPLATIGEAAGGSLDALQARLSAEEGAAKTAVPESGTPPRLLGRELAEEARRQASALPQESAEREAAPVLEPPESVEEQKARRAQAAGGSAAGARPRDRDGVEPAQAAPADSGSAAENWAARRLRGAQTSTVRMGGRLMRSRARRCIEAWAAATASPDRKWRGSFGSDWPQRSDLGASCGRDRSRRAGMDPETSRPVVLAPRSHFEARPGLGEADTFTALVDE